MGSVYCSRYDTVRICGDLKTTINQASITPLLRIEKLFAELSEGQIFSQVSHPGLLLILINRLPYRVASAAIFQRSMETPQLGLKGVSVYLAK